MAEEVKNVITDEQIAEAVKRVEELNKARTDLNSLKEELDVRGKDQENALKVFGPESNEYKVQLELVSGTQNRIEETEQKIKELSFKKSELKPVLDALAKKFEDAYKADTSREYHIELVPKKEGKPIDRNEGKKVYKKLLDYLNKDVEFDAKNAVNLLILVRNMEENKAWTNAQEFDNVIILRSASVLSLWRFITESFKGHGYFEAKIFLEVWANCGQTLNDAVRQIQKDNAATRQLGTQLDSVETEFDISEDDLPHDEAQVTTKEEVDPEIAE